MYGVYRSGSGKNGNYTSRRGMSIGIKFPSIYNHCLNSQAVEKLSFLRFLSKSDPLRGNFPNSVRKGFIATSVNLTCCVQIS